MSLEGEELEWSLRGWGGCKPAIVEAPRSELASGACRSTFALILVSSCVHILRQSGMRLIISLSQRDRQHVGRGR